jgi:hypothetical protein
MQLPVQDSRKHLLAMRFNGHANQKSRNGSLFALFHSGVPSMIASIEERTTAPQEQLILCWDAERLRVIFAELVVGNMLSPAFQGGQMLMRRFCGVKRIGVCVCTRDKVNVK